MAWTAPMTAVENAIYTSSEFNTYVRDNLLASEVPTATAAGQYIVSSGANALVARTPGHANTGTAIAETTASTSYVDLTTVGPAVTVTTGTSALVCISSLLGNNTATVNSFASYAVSGATTVAASDDCSIWLDGYPANSVPRWSAWHLRTGLTPGSNTFTMKYRVSAGTGSFRYRNIIVVPL